MGVFQQKNENTKKEEDVGTKTKNSIKTHPATAVVKELKTSISNKWND